jgi:hypothetical protein
MVLREMWTFSAGVVASVFVGESGTAFARAEPGFRGWRWAVRGWVARSASRSAGVGRRRLFAGRGRARPLGRGCWFAGLIQRPHAYLDADAASPKRHCLPRRRSTATGSRLVVLACARRTWSQSVSGATAPWLGRRALRPRPDARSQVARISEGSVRLSPWRREVVYVPVLR